MSAIPKKFLDMNVERIRFAKLETANDILFEAETNHKKAVLEDSKKIGVSCKQLYKKALDSYKGCLKELQDNQEGLAITYITLGYIARKLAILEDSTGDRCIPIKKAIIYLESAETIVRKEIQKDPKKWLPIANETWYAYYLLKDEARSDDSTYHLLYSLQSDFYIFIHGIEDSLQIAKKREELQMLSKKEKNPIKPEKRYFSDKFLHDFIFSFSNENQSLKLSDIAEIADVSFLPKAYTHSSTEAGLPKRPASSSKE